MESIVSTMICGLVRDAAAVAAHNGGRLIVQVRSQHAVLLPALHTLFSW